STEIISDNTEAISRSRTQHSKLYRADQWKSSRDEPDHSQQRRSAGENLNRTAFSLVTSDQSSAEFARNIRDVEANIVQMKERQKEMEQPQTKKSRGMDWGI
ncbi:mobilization protein, partial [Acinetobacter seifertii]